MGLVYFDRVLTVGSFRSMVIEFFHCAGFGYYVVAQCDGQFWSEIGMYQFIFRRVWGDPSSRHGMS
jgi:hypothetical protein